MLTAEMYLSITGEEAPQDLDVLAVQAEEMLHAATLYAYVGRDVDSMPKCISDRWHRALALEVQALSFSGGMAGLHDTQANSVSLGKYSYTINNAGSAEGTSSGALAVSVSQLMPMLVAYGRGLRGCCRCL